MNLDKKSLWHKKLESEISKDYFKELMNFITEERSKGVTVYPPDDMIFNAFKFTPFEEVKVVIIGQDPYHGEGQAHGLSFSVQRNVKKIPPSLKNIYKELKSDLGIEPPSHGCLESWAKQGVLLLNNVLTVEKSKPGSHRKKGWEQFTDKVIDILDKEKEGLVFILWGNDAKKKAKSINKDKHYIIESAHPSPFSCKNFYGSRPFSKVNCKLIKDNKLSIDWLNS
jgi:uracil-DNA glycosylase